MSEMTPLGAGFDLSIRGFGQASGGVGARREVTAACQAQRAGPAGRQVVFFHGPSPTLWPSHPIENDVDTTVRTTVLTTIDSDESDFIAFQIDDGARYLARTDAHVSGSWLWCGLAPGCVDRLRR